MTMVSVFEFRNKLADYLRLVEEGEEVAITRFDKPIARVVLPKKMKIKTIKDFKGFLGRGGETGEKYLKRVRRSKPGFAV